MCGISLLLSKHGFTPEYFAAFAAFSSRGPDYSKRETINVNDSFMKTVTLGFHRLAIMDPTVNGSQPFEIVDGSRTIYLMCNGEIYNFKELEEMLHKEHMIEFKSRSDCEVLPHLYKIYGFEPMLRMLNTAEFAISLVDHDKSTGRYDFYLARDHAGVRPLYFGINNDFLCFCSELKGIPHHDTTYCDQFEPGSYIHFTQGPDHSDIEKIVETQTLPYVKYYDITRHLDTKPLDFISDEAKALQLIREVFTKAVEDRLESDRPMGALLSGGLDSSLVCSIAAKYLRKKGKVLKTYSIGTEGGTDEFYARRVADFIGSDHTHILKTDQEFVDCRDRVIQVIESYDTTTVRASKGQYLISEWISENTDTKVLLIGDGSDELCSGYVYFHKAPNPLLAHEENVRLVKHIHKFDGERADRAISENKIEARVPFLDVKFINLYLSIAPELRIPREHDGRIAEKYLLRKAFDGYLPEECLWRPKEAFSDGILPVTKSYDEVNKNDPDSDITDKEFERLSKSYNHYTPLTKEELGNRKRFEKHFSRNVENVIPYRWMPKWVGDVTDPSARVLSVYEQDDNRSVTNVTVKSKELDDDTEMYYDPSRGGTVIKRATTL